MLCKKNNNADQPTHLHNLTNAFSLVHVIMVAMSRKCEMSVRVVSKCSLLHHDMAHFCALCRIIGQTEVMLISKDQKDRMLQSY